MIKKIDNEINWVGERSLILYDQEFERPLKEATQAFYAQKAEQWADEVSCHEYVLKVAHHLKREEQNCVNLLEYETKDKLIKIIEKELIENKAEMVTLKQGTGCEFMFNERKVEQLQMMYKVFSRVDDTLKHIIDQMNPYIMQEGGKIVSNPEN